MRPLRPVLLLAAIALAPAAVFSSTASAATVADPNVSSIASAPITIYGAKWCSACRSLERGLTDRKIAFEVVDVDDNPAAYARAKSAANASNAIPLTGIVRTSDTVWIVGADIDAVDRAHRGE